MTNRIIFDEVDMNDPKNAREAELCQEVMNLIIECFNINKVPRALGIAVLQRMITVELVNAGVTWKEYEAYNRRSVELYKSAWKENAASKVAITTIAKEDL